MTGENIVSLLAGAIVLCAVAFLFGAPPVHAGECRGASWYGPGFHGKRTASGAKFNENAMTAAHRTLPFGTKLRVTYRGRSVVVTITDRGPFHRGRALDLSKAAASKLGSKQAGVVRACWERL